MLIHMVQHFAAGFGHDDKVLHAHSKLARQVYARLNGEDHARLYGIGVGGAHIALFVIGLTDKVAQAVVEVGAIAGFGNKVAGRSVKIAETDARLDQRFGGGLCLPHQLVDLTLLLAGLPGKERPGHIGTVILIHAAHVDQDALARLQRGVVVVVVRVCRMSAKTADGGKADPGTAVGRIDAPDGFGHLFFGDAGANKSLKLRHAVIVDLGGSPHGLLLGSVFYGAGIVAGGGTALIDAIPAVKAYVDSVDGDEKTGAAIVLKALEEPVRQIAQNAGLEGSVVVENVKKAGTGIGFNALKNEYVDMLKAGIVDPAKVTRSALQNAASIASMVLTTETLVADKPEKEAPAPAAPGMGGMPGMM